MISRSDLFLTNRLVMLWKLGAANSSGTGSGGIGVPRGFTNSIIGGKGDKWNIGAEIARKFFGFIRRLRALMVFPEFRHHFWFGAYG